MLFQDRKCLLLLEAINSYHSSVDFSQSVSNKRSSLAKAPVVRDYPKRRGRQIHTKKKNANVSVRDTKYDGTKNKDKKISVEKKLEQSNHFSFGKCMPTRSDNHTASNLMENKSSTSAFPSILKDPHALKQRKVYHTRAVAFNQMKAKDKMLDNFQGTDDKNSDEVYKEAASKVNSFDSMVASSLQKNNRTVDEVTIIKPKLQTIKEAEELTSKKKRKRGNQYDSVVVQKRNSNLLVDNNNKTTVSVGLISDDNKVTNALQMFRAIYSRSPSHNFAYKEYVRKYGIPRQGVVGKIPGVEIGDEFYFREEMNIVGLHCQLVAGIDCVELHGRKIAISIISSNKKCDNDILMYLGTGGTFDKDKKLEGINLAMKNCIEDKTPIRVIYGQSLSGKKIYVYDGLYIAEKYAIKNCKLKFQLRRIPNQATIDIGGYGVLPIPLFYDISNGKEDKPIKVVNDVDDDRFPTPFNYIAKSIYPPSQIITKPICCNCVDGCSDLVKCACVVKNGGSLPFNSDGALMECKPLVYECGPDCKCPPSCDNRVSQHGIKFPLEVFKTKMRGWGVRSSSFIPSGSFICEYVGEVLEEEDAEKRTNDEYLFAIGSNYHDKSLWGDVVSSIPSLQKDACREVDVPGYSIDALKYGNVARFINHSCSPNLVAQELLYDNDDIRVPRIMLFAGEDIQPNQELTYDYNYNVDQVHDANGDIKKKECHCGSSECISWLY